MNGIKSSGRAVLATLLTCGLSQPTAAPRGSNLAAATTEDLLHIVIATASREPEGPVRTFGRINVEESIAAPQTARRLRIGFSLQVR